MKEDHDDLKSKANLPKVTSSIDWDKPIECVRGDSIFQARYIGNLANDIDRNIVAYGDGDDESLLICDRRGVSITSKPVTRNVKREPIMREAIVCMYEDGSVLVPQPDQAPEEGRKCIARKLIEIVEGEGL